MVLRLHNQLAKACIDHFAMQAVNLVDQNHEVLRHHPVDHAVQQWVVQFGSGAQPPIQVLQQLTRNLRVVHRAVSHPQLAKSAQPLESLSASNEFVEVSVEVLLLPVFGRVLALRSLALLKRRKQVFEFLHVLELKNSVQR